ncbi:hypothetical protein [Symbioplanes lichenis]|uniref:hypothetical protein n=1 Tax=Symbioplanes lichenis TaxID=1629072 RepID=UPI0027398D63|nr:hypothetical protein [Actinoplanes lichenis]
MRRTFAGAAAALCVLAGSSPAYAQSPAPRPDLRVTAELQVTGATPPTVGDGAWYYLTVTNTGRGPARDVRLTDLASHNIYWSPGNQDLTQLAPFELAPGESREFWQSVIFANEADVEGVAWASYRFTTERERNPADNSVRVQTPVVYGDAGYTVTALLKNGTLPGAGITFTYLRDGVEKTWRTVHTCAEGWISLRIPGGLYQVHFTAPEGYEIRPGYQDYRLLVLAAGDGGVVNTALDPVVADPPAPQPSTDPECTAA